MGDPVPSRSLRGQAVLADPLVRELLDAPLVAVLATFDRDGDIHAVPVWYSPHGEVVVLATGSRSRKVRNLERDPRATLVLHDSRPGFEVCGASLRGRIAIVRPPAARDLIDRVHRRYVDEAAEADREVAAFLDSDDVALRLTPSAAVTWDERGSAAAQALRSHGWAYPLVSTEPRG